MARTRTFQLQSKASLDNLLACVAAQDGSAIDTAKLNAVIDNASEARLGRGVQLIRTRTNIAALRSLLAVRPNLLDTMVDAAEKTAICRN